MLRYLKECIDGLYESVYDSAKGVVVADYSRMDQPDIAAAWLHS